MPLIHSGEKSTFSFNVSGQTVCVWCVCVCCKHSTMQYITHSRSSSTLQKRTIRVAYSHSRVYTPSHIHNRMCVCALHIRYTTCLIIDTSKVVTPTTFSSSPEYVYNVHVHVQRTCTCIYLLVYTFPYHTFSRHHITGIYM